MTLLTFTETIYRPIISVNMINSASFTHMAIIK